MTQLERAHALRARLHALFPAMVAIKDELRRLLDEAQNGSPAGMADGTIDEKAWNQLKAIEVGLRAVLIAQLFGSRVDELPKVDQ